MTRRGHALSLALVLTAALAAACGPDRPKTKTRYVSSYLDVSITPDATCDQSVSICVYALESRLLTQGGEEIATACTDVEPILGAPAQVIADLGILAGAGIAEELPASGLIGVEFRSYGQDCAALAKAPGLFLTVFSGYAEIELTAEDQQLVVPVSCDQPQEPCVAVTPAACAGCGT